MTESSLQHALKRSAIARDVYELPNGWVRTIGILLSTSLIPGVLTPITKAFLFYKSPSNFEGDMLIPKVL